MGFNLRKKKKELSLWVYRSRNSQSATQDDEDADRLNKNTNTDTSKITTSPAEEPKISEPDGTEGKGAKMIGGEGVLFLAPQGDADTSRHPVRGSTLW